jgi:phosphoglycolate phosphatase-like HAD superfamily hydrolase/CMP-N-acetylneuraminic acid synthetase
METVAAFVPLKLKSRRLPNKNFLRLGDRPLCYHIFNTLVSISSISKVYCYTSQPQILSLLPETVELLMRPRRLDGHHVKANELFRYSVENIDADVIVLCHATGPYIKGESISKGIHAVLSGDYDCAFAVKRLQTYSWYDNKPLNYDPNDMSQTQDLKPVFAETSGFYIFRKADYLTNNTRIGVNPFLVEVDFKESVDIDDPQDLSLATLLFDYNSNIHNYSRDNFFVDMANNSIKFKKIKHISFDLDGVLIDSINVMRLAWDNAMKISGQSICFSEYKKFIGIPFEKILDNVGCLPDCYTQVKEVYDRFSSNSLEQIKTFEGVKEGINLAVAAGLKVSIVTSKNSVRTHEILKRHFPKIIFDAVVTPEDVSEGRGKPNPDPILLACIKVGVDPFNTIYVGDMEFDRDSANRAGVHFVHAAWGYADLCNVKDMWFNSMEDMIDFVLN